MDLSILYGSAVVEYMTNDKLTIILVKLPHLLEMAQIEDPVLKSIKQIANEFLKYADCNHNTPFNTSIRFLEKSIDIYSPSMKYEPATANYIKMMAK